MKSFKRIIRRPLVTEKSTVLKDKANQYVFEVEPNSGKIEIKKEVERTFGVKVKKVHTHFMHGKIKTYGRFKGKRPDRKRAIVTLVEGNTIDFFEGV